MRTKYDAKSIRGADGSAASRPAKTIDGRRRRIAFAATVARVDVLVSEERQEAGHFCDAEGVLNGGAEDV